MARVTAKVAKLIRGAQAVWCGALLGLWACSRETPSNAPPAASQPLMETSTVVVAPPVRTSVTGEVFTVEESAEFAREALSNTLPVLVMFHQRGSAPCVMMLPTLHRMAREYAGRVCVLDVDVSKPALRKLEPQYTILSLPTFVFMRGGREQYRLVGTTKPDRLAFMIDTKLLAPGTIPPHRK